MSAASKPEQNTALESRDGRVRFAGPDAFALLEGHVDSLDAPGEPAWTRIKHNASRTVYRGAVSGHSIYLKQFHGRSLAHKVAKFLGVSRAAREMHFAQYLRANGVATPEPLAASSANPEWVATLEVPGAVQGDLWHTEQAAAGESGRRAIRHAASLLAKMVARMHAAGVIHSDLHCGNVLIVEGASGPEPVLTDLHRLKRRKRLSRTARAANLAQLLHDRRDTTSRTERLRFLKDYLAAAGAAGTLRGWEFLIRSLGRRYTRKHYARRDRRIKGSNRYFAHLSLPGGWSGSVALASKYSPPASKAADQALTLDAWREVLSDLDALMSDERAEVVKDSPSGKVVRRMLKVGDTELDVYIKRPRRKRSWKVIVDCFRRSRPLKAFRSGHQLLARGVNTALPLAAIERRSGPFLTDAILITETVPASHLNQFLHVRFAHVADPQLAGLSESQAESVARHVLDDLGRVVRRLHDNNLAHRDLKSGNILVYWTPESGPSVVLVDLDGLREVSRISMRQRFQGLMRLNVSLLECTSVSHAGRLRMLLSYMRRPGCGRISFKPYWRVLQVWSAAKLRQQIRSRRKRQRGMRRTPA